MLILKKKIHGCNYYLRKKDEWGIYWEWTGLKENAHGFSSTETMNKVKQKMEAKDNCVIDFEIV